MADFNSPYYPYEKVQEGFLTMHGAEEIPLKLVRYLLDLPDSEGYQPSDDNKRPRVRLMKYLWNDGERPLDNPLPTPWEKLSLLFEGSQPDLNSEQDKAEHPKGYRMFAQAYVGTTQLTAMSTVKCYIGRINGGQFGARINIIFEIFVNGNNETTTRTDAYSRAYDIEQSIVEALSGVNITGVGVCYFVNSIALHDEGTNVGRSLTMALDWMES